MLVSDWADDKAREWLEGTMPPGNCHIPSLAALLREVAEAARVEFLRDGDLMTLEEGAATVEENLKHRMAEVRRVVEERLAYGRENFEADWTGADLVWLLARLEKL